MANVNALYAELLDLLRNTALLESTGSVLGWDEQTYLPAGGAEHRANQLSLISGLAHEQRTSPRVGELLGELESENLGPADEPMAVNVREARRDYDKATKLPKKLVEEMSRVVSLSQQAWIEARKQKDFAKFLPWLNQVVSLKRQEAEALGYAGGIPYDALLDRYEPGAKSSEVTAAFAALRDELVPLVAAIRDAPRKPNADIITRNYPREAQRKFGMDAAAKIGFRLDEGRLDEAAHPFCSGFGPGDCRLTTRYDEQHFNGAFFGTLHEAGHGMYEQGLNREAYGSPMGDAVSLGIHESQSRMWENFVGRSRAFWEHFYGPAQKAFPEALSDVPLDDFHFAVNDVRPSFIRVEADEVTYNLHIMLRFELEQPLIAGELQPADLPGVWNEKFQQFFDLTPPHDSLGCMQDIHWSAGLIGYFPTYALGNMYAAQFFQAAQQELGDLSALFAKGEFAPLLKWLNENIHQRGRQYSATELVRVVTGKPLSHKPLMEHLHAKYDELYGL
jgi:carboxypeptidase Taq